MREFDLPLVRESGAAAYHKGWTRTFDCPHIERGVREIWQAGYDEAQSVRSKFFCLEVVESERHGDYRVSRYADGDSNVWIVAVERWDIHWGWLRVTDKDFKTWGSSREAFEDQIRKVKGINA